MKADKGNSIVILGKEEYDDRVLNLLENGPYKICKSVNPLNLMIAEVKRKAISIFGAKNFHKDEELGVNKFQLYVTNPTIPKLYCLPKIHKSGNQMRPIVSCIPQ